MSFLCHLGRSCTWPILGHQQLPCYFRQMKLDIELPVCCILTCSLQWFYRTRQCISINVHGYIVFRESMLYCFIELAAPIWGEGISSTLWGLIFCDPPHVRHYTLHCILFLMWYMLYVIPYMNTPIKKSTSNHAIYRWRITFFSKAHWFLF